ncbi:MAG: Short-chain dehydrogenase/reductase [Chthoniobacter sp.]|jgi:short-subunit dehydrogenase|nr:Short-chain dehydrogenase/reductase [Chthoniobacter sp.]
MNFFHGCTALITGASSGFGAEYARQLAPYANTLILVARRRDRLEALQAELARPGLAIHCHTADLADSAQTEAFLAALAASGDKVTLLINNAGVGDHGFFDEGEWSRIAAMLDVNIKALTRVTHAVLPDLVRAGRGAILNVSSIASLLPLPKMAVYAASKAYVTSFSEALRGELRDTGVTVTAVCPGPVNTEFFELAERRGATEPMPAPEFFKIPAAQVVRESLAAVARGRARIIPGWVVWAVMTLTTLVPIFILRLFLRERRTGS